jgi:hypothetical protein
MMAMTTTMVTAMDDGFDADNDGNSDHHRQF